MRNELVYQAHRQIACRFLLCAAAAKISRKFHRPADRRVPETINASFGWIAQEPSCCQVPGDAELLTTDDTEESRA